MALTTRSADLGLGMPNLVRSRGEPCLVWELTRPSQMGDIFGTDLFPSLFPWSNMPLGGAGMSSALRPLAVDVKEEAVRFSPL